MCLFSGDLLEILGEGRMVRLVSSPFLSIYPLIIINLLHITWYVKQTISQIAVAP